MSEEEMLDLDDLMDAEELLENEEYFSTEIDDNDFDCYNNKIIFYDYYEELDDDLK